MGRPAPSTSWPFAKVILGISAVWGQRSVTNGEVAHIEAFGIVRCEVRAGRAALGQSDRSHDHEHQRRTVRGGTIASTMVEHDDDEPATARRMT